VSAYVGGAQREIASGGGIISGKGGGGIISGQGRGLETFSGRARGKHELSPAGVFPPCGKPPVIIADVPSLLAEHHKPSRSNSTQTCFLSVDRSKRTRTDRLRRHDASACWRCPKATRTDQNISMRKLLVVYSMVSNDG
jgi:hypothetical protein